MRSRHWFASRVDGDFADPDAPAHPGHGFPARPWTWLRQVHGADVVTISAPGEHAGVAADAAVTAVPGCALVIRTADCAPVVLDGDGVVGIAHAGWKGLEAGVLGATVIAMRALGAGAVTAHLGPTIRPGCYEFGVADLDRLVARFGAAVRSRTTDGRPALDLPAAVGVALDELGVASDTESPCTACDSELWFSHRARRDVGRQASFAWLAP